MGWITQRLMHLQQQLHPPVNVNPNAHHPFIPQYPPQIQPVGEQRQIIPQNQPYAPRPTQRQPPRRTRRSNRTVKPPKRYGFE